MPVLNKRSMTINNTRTTRGASSGSGVHKFMGRATKNPSSGITGSHSLEAGLIHGLDVARATLAASLDRGFKRAGRKSFNSSLRTSQSSQVGGHINLRVANSVPGLAGIDIETEIYNAMLSSLSSAEGKARSHMSESFGSSEPILDSGKRGKKGSLIKYTVQRTGGQITFGIDPPTDWGNAGKLFALNFGTGPKNSLG